MSRFRPEVGTLQPVEDPDGSLGFRFLGDKSGQAYNEEAFRYFLAVERKRAQRSNTVFLLLLVTLTDETGTSQRLEPPIAKRLFSALRYCVRDTDFVGWYRDEREAGAVLTQLGEAPDAAVFGIVVERLRGALTRRFPARVADRLHVRIYLPPTGAGGGQS